MRDEVMAKLIIVLTGLGIIATGIYFTFKTADGPIRLLTTGLIVIGLLVALIPWTKPEREG